jgi:hypothetical protein
LEEDSSFKLVYSQGGGDILDAFTDSYWVKRKLNTGLMARKKKSWQSILQCDQRCRRLSTAEAKYYLASEMMIEITYLCNLLENLGFP